MIEKLTRVVDRTFALLTANHWIWLLAARIGVGGEFFLSGKGKLGRLGEFVAYFQKLGIPAPTLQAPFIATLECVGGLCIVLGLATRLFGFLLGCTMVIAMLTAVDFTGKSLADFFYMSEWLLLLLLWGFVFTGAGRASLDRLIAARRNTSAR
jgi:putative oxidoreductase